MKIVITNVLNVDNFVNISKEWLLWRIECTRLWSFILYASYLISTNLSSIIWSSIEIYSWKFVTIINLTSWSLGYSMYGSQSNHNDYQHAIVEMLS